MNSGTATKELLLIPARDGNKIQIRKKLAQYTAFRPLVPIWGDTAGSEDETGNLTTNFATRT